MNFFSYVFVAAVLTSCGSTKQVSSTDELPAEIESILAKPERNVKIKAILGDFKDSDIFEYKSVRIEGNIMFIEITFSGGCAAHKYELIGSSMVLKTFPPKRSIMLIHDNGDDTCRSMVTRTIEVDIKDLAYNPTANAEIVFLLKGWKEEIKYIYQ